MPRIWFKSVPLCKEDVTLALESGVDGLIVPTEAVSSVAALARCTVKAEENMPSLFLQAKEDEEQAVQRLRAGEQVVLAAGWEIIPVENLLAQCDSVAVEARNLEEARLAAGILERGARHVVVLPSALAE